MTYLQFEVHRLSALSLTRDHFVTKFPPGMENYTMNINLQVKKPDVAWTKRWWLKELTRENPSDDYTQCYLLTTKIFFKYLRRKINNTSLKITL